MYARTHMFMGAHTHTHTHTHTHPHTLTHTHTHSLTHTASTYGNRIMDVFFYPQRSREGVPGIN